MSGGQVDDSAWWPIRWGSKFDDEQSQYISSSPDFAAFRLPNDRIVKVWRSPSEGRRFPNSAYQWEPFHYPKGSVYPHHTRYLPDLISLRSVLMHISQLGPGDPWPEDYQAHLF